MQVGATTFQNKATSNPQLLQGRGGLSYWKKKKKKEIEIEKRKGVNCAK